MNNTENNILMADFLGLESNEYGYINDNSSMKYISEFSHWDYGRVAKEHLMFYSDWNWLMVIVERIESLGYWVQIKRNHCLIENFENSYQAKEDDTFFVNQVQWGKDKSHATYNACMEFINWYNIKSSKK